MSDEEGEEDEDEGSECDPARGWDDIRCEVLSAFYQSDSNFATWTMAPDGAVHFECRAADNIKDTRHTTRLGAVVPPPPTASDCAYHPMHPGVGPGHPASKPLPQLGVISGSIELKDVPGAHLDYTLSLEVGAMLAGELYDTADGNPPAFVEYATVMDVYETFVPAALRGKGCAERLTRAAFGLATLCNYYVRPTCTYLSETFLPRRLASDEASHYTRRVLFTSTPAGRGAEGRRRELVRKSAAELKTLCDDAGVKVGGRKCILIERLVTAEFIRAAREHYQMTYDGAIWRMPSK